MPSPQELDGLVEEVTPLAVELRRLLHRHPEPSYQEHQTTALIASAFRDEGVETNLRSPATGLWVDTGPNPRIGFRADLDALPISEPEDNVPRSQNNGWMHACGHDAHAAIAFGITLVARRLGLDPAVRVLFQPAEESYPGGACEMVAEGLVDGLSALLAFHVDPGLQTGKVGAKPGPITGSADSFRIVLNGPGGHTARPDRTVDLVDAAARVVRDLPTAVRRSIDSRVPIATVFGAIHGGDAGNVIPTEVMLQGTVRTLDRSIWDVLPGLVDKSLSSILAFAGASYNLEYRQGIPPVVNDREVVGEACEGIMEHLGPESVVPAETSMGGEDFANYLTEVPGALLRLGAESGGGDLHSATFSVDENAVGVGIKAGIAAILGLIDSL